MIRWFKWNNFHFNLLVFWYICPKKTPVKEKLITSLTCVFLGHLVELNLSNLYSWWGRWSRIMLWEYLYPMHNVVHTMLWPTPRPDLVNIHTMCNNTTNYLLWMPVNWAHGTSQSNGLKQNNQDIFMIIIMHHNMIIKILGV